MADIELVIKIPEEEYRWIKESDKTVFADVASKECMLHAIKTGTPLPKGHGDLIDRRELKKEVYTTTEWNGDVHRIIYEASVDDAPTIIEAESEEDGLANLDSMLEDLWNATESEVEK